MHRILLPLAFHPVLMLALLLILPFEGCPVG
jgi:hypothetical protein